MYNQSPGITPDNRGSVSDNLGPISALAGAAWIQGEAAYHWRRHHDAMDAEKFRHRIIGNVPRGVQSMASNASVGLRSLMNNDRFAYRSFTNTAHPGTEIKGKIPWRGMSNRTVGQHLSTIPMHSLDFFGLGHVARPGFMRQDHDKLNMAKGNRIRGRGLMRAGGAMLGTGIIGGYAVYDWIKDDAPVGLLATRTIAEAGAWGIGWGVGAAAGSAMGGAMGAAAGSFAMGAATFIPAAGLAMGGAMAVHGVYQDLMDKAKAPPDRAWNAPPGQRMRQPVFTKNDILNGTYTMRQRSLSAISKSPMNDRARLLGGEARYLHM